jgi:hypothetical protein
MRSDLDIKRDVEDELRSDPDIDATDIAIAVKDGVVTLAGFVRSFRQKRKAEEDVKHFAGVIGVVNNIEVRLPIIHTMGSSAGFAPERMRPTSNTDPTSFACQRLSGERTPNPARGWPKGEAYKVGYRRVAAAGAV